MLAAAVASKGQRTLPSDDVPEVVGSVVVGFEIGRATYRLPIVGQPAVLERIKGREFADTFEAHHLGHLRVGMHIVEIVYTLRHRGEQSAVRETHGHAEVFRFAGDGVGIGQHLVHAAVLVAQHSLHLLVAETCRQVDGPIAESEEELLRLLVATIEPRIAQACVHLM